MPRSLAEKVDALSPHQDGVVHEVQVSEFQMSQFLVAEAALEGQQDANPHVRVSSCQESLVLVRLINRWQSFLILGLGRDVCFIYAGESQPGYDPHMLI